MTTIMCQGFKTRAPSRSSSSPSSYFLFLLVWTHLISQLTSGEKAIGISLQDSIDPEDLIRFVKGLEEQEAKEGEGETHHSPEDALKYSPVSATKGVLWDNGTFSEEEEEKLQGREGDMVFLPLDLTDLKEELGNDVAAGVEESLLLFGGNKSTAGQAETRQMSLYMFQGQYTSEPRLNKFIDGAMRNMGGEMRISSMDPIFFRVLPRGRVQQRDKPFGRGKNKKRRPGNNGRRKKRSPPPDLTVVKDLDGDEDNTNSEPRTFGIRRRQMLQKRRRMQRIAAQRRKKQQQRRRQQQQNNRNKFKNRKSRGFAGNVGGGKVEGLSKVTRDGDAEMQLFGNYTLIRSHMKMGPIDLTMQFRTRRGIRRTGATLPALRVHTVTRVNHEGSEMVDFLLDRPHPETIQVRGNLFPMARKIARNVFSRLFLPESFLVQKIREKTGLALLSKPTVSHDHFGHTNY